MIYLLKNKISTVNWVLIFIGIGCFLFVFNWSWKGPHKEGYKQVINSDGKGYYMYLPNAFINNNLSDQQVDNRYILSNKKGKAFNKYYVGTSLLMSPFFWLGHATAYIQNDKMDGYSPPYQKAISVAGLFYLLIGLFFISRMLSLFGFKPFTISIVILAITFGTNLFSYAILMPSMSHIYSFFCFSGFLFFYTFYFKTSITRYHYFGILFLCLIVLIRPLNGIVIFAIPLLGSSWKDFLLKLHCLFSPKIFFFSILISSILLIQPLVWFLQTGNFIIWSYQHEGFEFSSPHFFEVLFGFRKGWFIYTPLALISFFGVIFWIKKSKFFAFYFLGFFLVTIYLISSWWNWYYGPSFSQRPFVEFYPLLIIPLAYLIKSQLRSLALVCITFFVFINLIQNYQYQYNIISAWDMNWDKYRYTFLKTGEKYQNCLGGNNDLLPYKAKKSLIYSCVNNFESNSSFWNTGEYVMSHGNAFSNYNQKEYNTTFEYSFELINPSTRGLFIESSLSRYQLNQYASKEALVIIETFGENGFQNYYGFKLDEIPSKTINKLEVGNYFIEIPTFRGLKGKVKFYIWNKGLGAFFIDNIKLKLYSLN